MPMMWGNLEACENHRRKQDYGEYDEENRNRIGD